MMSNPANVHFVEEWYIRFADDTRRWVKIKQFSTGSSNDQNLLRELIADERYRDDYIGTDPSEHDVSACHGPYQAALIAADSFSKVAALGLRTAWDEFTSESPVNEETLHKMEVTILRRSEVASAVYRLDDLGKDAHHGHGWVLDEFHEFIVIDRPSREALLVVMGRD